MRVAAVRCLARQEGCLDRWILGGGALALAMGRAREIAEELGPAFRLEMTDVAVTWTRRRPSDGVFQFIVGRMCRHAGGEPVLSAEHDALAWLGPGEHSGLAFPTESGYATALAALWQRVKASG